MQGTGPSFTSSSVTISGVEAKTFPFVSANQMVYGKGGSSYVQAKSGTIYAVGGWPAKAEYWTPSTQKWDEIPNNKLSSDTFPAFLYSKGLEMNSGRIMFFGGASHIVQTSSDGRYIGYSTNEAADWPNIYCYNPGATAYACPNTNSPSTTLGRSFGGFFSSYNKLTDGRVLSAGGLYTLGYYDIGDSNYAYHIVNAENSIYDETSNTITTLSQNLNVPRYDHAGITLKNGKVLLFSGRTSETSLTNTIEVFDPAAISSNCAGSSCFTQLAATTATARTGALPLMDPKTGKIYLFGGCTNANAQSACTESKVVEVFDPSNNTLTSKLQMTTARGAAFGSYLSLSSGQSGFLIGSSTSKTFEFYTIASNTWTAYPSTTNFHEALFPFTTNSVTNFAAVGAGTSEIYNFTFAWTTPTVVTFNFSGSCAVKNSQGQVIITGGGASGNQAILFDPINKVYRALANLPQTRSSHSCLALAGDKILIWGGTTGTTSDTADIYDPTTSSWTETTGIKHYWGTGVAMPTGEALLIGGVTLAGGTYASTPDYTITMVNGGAISTIATMSKARRQKPAAILYANNTKILIAGGDYEYYDDGDGPILTPFNTSAILDISSGVAAATLTESSLGTLSTDGTRLLLLNDGRVYKIGLYRTYGSPTSSYLKCDVFDPAYGTWYVGPIEVSSNIVDVSCPTDGYYSGSGAYIIGDNYPSVPVLSSTGKIFFPANQLYFDPINLMAGFRRLSEVVLDGGTYVMGTNGYSPDEAFAVADGIVFSVPMKSGSLPYVNYFTYPSLTLPVDFNGTDSAQVSFNVSGTASGSVSSQTYVTNGAGTDTITVTDAKGRSSSLQIIAKPPF